MLFLPLKQLIRVGCLVFVGLSACQPAVYLSAQMLIGDQAVSMTQESNLSATGTKKATTLAKPPETLESSASAYPLSFQMKSLDGTLVDLKKYEGKPLLVVNTASKCGLTKQYKGLQKLHKAYSDRGLQVLGFPCNQFRGQEPGDSDAIATFCQKNYGVSFQMFAKIDVKGDDQCELYQHLTQQETSPKGAGNVSWNFEKFLIDSQGRVAARFNPRVKPTSKAVIEQIEKLLPQTSEQ